ncbi:hypothetical protein SEA_GIBBLES_57 [Gordonia phage Gibbles]|nr:hypothetical protein SEA_GIBBLES_57 [Gordonia phage Gibbles]
MKQKVSAIYCDVCNKNSVVGISPADANFKAQEDGWYIIEAKNTLVFHICSATCLRKFAKKPQEYPAHDTSTASA